MSEQIASGSINIEVNDREAIARLHEIDAEFDRAMARIDRQHAEAKIGADLSELDRNLKEAEAKVKAYDKRIEAAENNRSKAQLERQRQKAKLNEEFHRAELRLAKEELAATKKQNSELERTEKRVALIERAERKKAAVVEQAERKRAAAAAKAQRDSERAQRLAEKEAAAQERFATRAEQRAARATAAREKEIAAIPKMQRQYAELAQRIERLNNARGKTHGDDRARLIVDLKVKEAVADMAVLKKTLERLGSPINLDVDLHPGRDAGVRLRNWFSGNQGGALHMASAAGVQLGERMGSGLASAFRRRASRGLSGNLKDLGRTAGGGVLNVLGDAGSKVGKGLEGLSSATVRLGPFTTSIRGAITGLSILGPMLVDLVGALGSLVSVTGSAAVGLSALAGGAVVPLAAGFLGLKFSMRNTGQEVANARKTINAYQFAVQKYGAESGKAKKKQAQMNHTLAAISPLARETAKGIETFYDNWDKHSKGTRQSLGSIAHEGFKALNDITPMWAARTNDMAKVLATNLGGAFKYLGKGEGRGLLDNMMGNMNQSLGPVLAGLGHLAQYLLRVANLASNRLPGLARVFEDWSKGILRTSDDTVALNKRLGNTIKSAQDVGKFFMASGRFLKAFFSAGVGAGQDFTVTMTKALSRWTADLQTPQGAAKMQDFFRQSVTGAQALYNALAPVIQSFVTWAASIAPLARAFFDAASAITGFVNQLLRITALRGPLTAIATTLGVMWGIGKISAATRALTGFSAALFGVGRAQAAVAATGAASNVVGMGAVAAAGRAGAGRAVGAAESAAAGAAGARAAAGLSRGAKAAGMFRTALTGIGGAVGIANPLVGAAVITVGALAFAFSRAKSAADKSKESFSRAGKAATDTAMGYRADVGQLGDLTSQHARAAVAVREARKQLAHTKKGTDEYKIALMDLRDAQRTYLSTGQQLHAMEADASKQSAKQLANERERLATFDKRNKKELEHQRNIAKTSMNETARAEAEQKVNNILSRRTALEQAVERAMNRHAAAAANVQRGAAGMLPVLGAAEQKLGALARRSRGTAMKVALKFDAPKDVGKVSASASKSLKAGVPNRIVTKIVADSSNADQAVRRLRAARIDPKKLRVLMQGGDAAVRMLERIAGRKLTRKELRVAEHGGSGVLDVLGRIESRKLREKIARLTARDLASAIIKRVDGTRLRDKSFRISAQASQAISAIGSVGSMLFGLHDKTIRVNTIVSHSGKGAGKARGTGPGSAIRALVGEGRGPEIIADHKTGEVMKVSSPTFMHLNKDQSVIPTESAYRQRGKKFMLQFARDMGIPAFAGGVSARKKHKAPKVTEHKKANARGEARKNLKAKEIKNPGAYAEVKRVTDLQHDEADQRARISIAESKLKEPTSFLTKVGQDSQGNDIFAINQSEINRWSTDLANMAAMYDALATILKNLQTAVDQALTAVTTSIASSSKNLKAIKKLEDHEHSIIGRKGTSKVGIAEAKERLRTYEGEANAQRKIRDDAQQSRDSLLDEQRYAGVPSRIDEALKVKGDYLNDSAAVAGRGAEELASNTTRPDVDPFAALNGRVGSLDAETALASIGQGLLGGAPRSGADIIADQIKANQGIIDLGRTMLGDTDPNNDSAAYSAISGAASAIQGFQGSLGATAAESMTLSTARQDLLTSMGSNFSPVAGATMAARMSTRGALGYNAASAAGGPTVVNVHNTFPTPPADPHTWSRGLAFELQAAM